MDSDNKPQLTFGQLAVGFTFNPSNNTDVQIIKSNFANIIDKLHSVRLTTEDSEVKRLISVAITEAQTSCMWAVKALTWSS